MILVHRRVIDLMSKFRLSSIILSIMSITAQPLFSYESQSTVQDEVSNSILNPLALATRTSPLMFKSSARTVSRPRDYIVLQPGESKIFARFSAPAVIHRLWFTSDQLADITVHIRTAEEPNKVVYGSSMNSANNKPALHLPSRPYLSAEWAGSIYTYEPIHVREPLSLVVNNRSKDEVAKFFFHVSYRPLDHSAKRLSPGGQSDPNYNALTAGMASLLIGHEVRAPATKILSETKRLIIRPGQRSTALKLTGPGVILSIRIKPNPCNINVLKNVVIEGSWDRKSKPEFIARLPWLCGHYFGITDVHSLMVGTKNDTFVIRFPMPFKNEARISFVNENQQQNVSLNLEFNWIPLETGEVPPFRIHAVSGNEKSIPRRPFVLLDTQGTGNLVGCTLGVKGTFHRTLALLEPNDQIFVDGEPKPTFAGTGTEDFFNGAWYFPDKPGSFPFHGLTFKDSKPIRVSAYRWLLVDRIPFRHRLKFIWDHTAKHRPGDISYMWTVVWYQSDSLSD